MDPYGILVKRLLIKIGDLMVEFVKISKKGTLLKIKEVSDKYRHQLYRWDEDE